MFDLFISDKYIEPDGKPHYLIGAEILDVPILYHSSQKFAFWNPPNVGDTGLLLHTDSPFDFWWETGKTDIEPNNPRKRNRSDGMFLPGGWSKAKGMLNASAEWCELRNMVNDTRVAIKDGEVHIQAGGSSLVLSETGFDVIVGGMSLIQELMKATVPMSAPLVYPFAMPPEREGADVKRP